MTSACVFFAATLGGAFGLEEFYGDRSDDFALTKDALARQYDEGTRDPTFSPPGLPTSLSQAALESLANEARSPRAMLVQGEGRWLDTVVHLGSYAFVAERRLACASAHGRDIDVCFSRLITIVEPADEGKGMIAHAYSEIVDPSNGPSPSSRNHPDCEKYAQCVARARIGEVIPIPDDERSVLALDEFYQFDAMRPELLDAEKVRAMISQFDEGLAMLEAQPPGTLDEAWKLAKTREHASYLRRHLRRLESVEADRHDDHDEKN